MSFLLLPTESNITIIRVPTFVNIRPSNISPLLLRWISLHHIQLDNKSYQLPKTFFNTYERYIFISVNERMIQKGRYHTDLKFSRTRNQDNTTIQTWSKNVKSNDTRFIRISVRSNTVSLIRNLSRKNCTSKLDEEIIAHLAGTMREEHYIQKWTNRKPNLSINTTPERTIPTVEYVDPKRERFHYKCMEQFFERRFIDVRVSERSVPLKLRVRTNENKVPKTLQSFTSSQSNYKHHQGKIKSTMYVKYLLEQVHSNNFLTMEGVRKTAFEHNEISNNKTRKSDGSKLEILCKEIERLYDSHAIQVAPFTYCLIKK